MAGSALEYMAARLPHAQSYLRGFILDDALFASMNTWELEQLPEEWDPLDYSGVIPDSRFVGVGKRIVETTFRDAQASASSRRLLVADHCVDLQCPFFYFEVSIQARDLCDTK